MFLSRMLVVPYENFDISISRILVFSNYFPFFIAHNLKDINENIPNCGQLNLNISAKGG
jgi:hypothetical protein